MQCTGPRNAEPERETPLPGVGKRGSGLILRCGHRIRSQPGSEEISRKPCGER